MTRQLSLCADDFGCSESVDRAILQLVARRRLTEVSCIVNLPRWPGAVQELLALPAVAAGVVRLGLHFNLTEGRPLSAALRWHWPQLPSLPRLLMLAPLRLLPRAALRDELRAQLASFGDAVGASPAHLDGHQHVHHLPVIRDGVLDELSSRPALRVRHTGCLPGPGFGFKRRVIMATGGSVLGRALVRRGRHANTALLGVYDFLDPDYRAHMQRWLAAAPADGGLIFCHPGLDAVAAGDPIATARVRELSYLDSPAFDEDLAASGTTLDFSAQNSSRG